jgi:hypothetical protein
LVRTCNPSDSGGRGKRVKAQTSVLRPYLKNKPGVWYADVIPIIWETFLPAWAKSLKPYLENKLKAKGLGVYLEWLKSRFRRW